MRITSHARVLARASASTMAEAACNACGGGRTCAHDDGRYMYGLTIKERKPEILQTEPPKSIVKVLDPHTYIAKCRKLSPLQLLNSEI